jgi:hypothetical protein
MILQSSSAHDVFDIVYVYDAIGLKRTTELGIYYYKEYCLCTLVALILSIFLRRVLIICFSSV